MDIIQDLYNFNPWWESPFIPHEIRREKYLKLLKDFFCKKDIIVLTL